MSKFSTIFHELEDDAKIVFAGARTELMTDVDTLATKLKSDIPPIGYAIIKGAILTSEATSGTWSAKLVSAVGIVAAQFAAKGIPVVINDIVAAITAIIASLNAEKTKLSA